MKHSEFAELCQREWSQADHGDIVTLNLTNDSLVELAADAAHNPGEWFTRISGNDAAVIASRVAAGAKVTEAVNPVTRSIVTVNGDADVDSATAKCLPDWSVSPEPRWRVVPIG